VSEAANEVSKARRARRQAIERGRPRDLAFRLLRSEAAVSEAANEVRKARGRPREQGEAKERSSRVRARVAADAGRLMLLKKHKEAARRRASERRRPRGLTFRLLRAEAAE
jgi:hypothetical protein